MKKKEIDKRRLFGIIIGGILFLSCVLFFTYAYYTWRSENTTFSFDIKDQNASIICENGPNVYVSNIGPVLDYNDGVSATFKVQNSGVTDSAFTLSLNITSISNTLLVESFKYILLKGNIDGTSFTETGISGNFSSFQVGSNIISNTVSVDANSSNTFKFIVYIDGIMYNSPNMMELSMNSSLMIGNCDSISTVQYLSDVEPGSYVAYTGTNGCPDGHCDGTNANYVSDTDMGYCASSSYKFSVNGWRVGYIQNDSAYLISAGSVECMCSNSDGTTSNSSCGSKETTAGVPLHLANLDNKALTYCNSTYAYGGVCNSSSAWAMDATDFEVITGSVLSFTSCNRSSSDTACGYGNDLIDNGGYYWFATAYSSSSTYAFYWFPRSRYVYNFSSTDVNGVRPVLRLASTVQVVGGSGTYEDPYQIENPTSTVQYLSDVEPGSYVAYTGTNGCPDGHCDGTNANYVSDTDMGYCSSSSYKFSVNGWRVGYIQNDTAYLVSAGSVECMCTNSDGTTSGSSCSSNEETSGVPLHLANLDNKALTYCNSTYAYGGVCNSSSAWAMDATDFEAITGSVLSPTSCFGSDSDTSCGYGNDLIDNGGLYWFATAYSSSSAFAFSWSPSDRFVYSYNSFRVYGVRPVLRLASTVQVVGGSGTYEDPYQISS